MPKFVHPWNVEAIDLSRRGDSKLPRNVPFFEKLCCWVIYLSLVPWMVQPIELKCWTKKQTPTPPKTNMTMENPTIWRCISYKKWSSSIIAMFVISGK